MVDGLFYTLPSIPGLTSWFVLILQSSHKILSESHVAKSLPDLITHIYQTKNLTFCQSKTCLSCAKGNLKFVSYEKLSLFWFYDSQNLASFSSQPLFDALPSIKTLMVSWVTVQQNKTLRKVRPGNSRGKCIKESNDHASYTLLSEKWVNAHLVQAFF